MDQESDWSVGGPLFACRLNKCLFLYHCSNKESGLVSFRGCYAFTFTQHRYDTIILLCF